LTDWKFVLIKQEGGLNIDHMVCVLVISFSH